MIEANKRKSVYSLHQHGMSIREIARRLHLNRTTVRTIISQKGELPNCPKNNKIAIEAELLRSLYSFCNGRIQRIHEIITERHDIKISYTTLCKRVRDLGLGVDVKKRCFRVEDKPGREMQHDTSVYKVKVGDKEVKVVASVLYYRYSKIRYLKFYRNFNRFRMKCFFHEALIFWGYSAGICIIDNTNLARLRGSGYRAVIVGEMESFAAQYGFKFVCHEIGHANRKAGNERSFFTIETNFFPGRIFADMKDLNTQAREWSTVRLPNRPVNKGSFIPIKAFEYEQSFLRKLPACLPAPYQVHHRLTDQYGYICFEGNFFWVPGTTRGQIVVLEYDAMIELYLNKHLIARYSLPVDGLKNERFSPQGQPPPHYQPNNRKKPAHDEEKKLRKCSEHVDAYLNFSLEHTGRQRHRYIRQVYALYQKLAQPLFIATLKRALKYRITDIRTIERIALLLMKNSTCELPSICIDEEFQSRDTYQEGRICDDVDLQNYDDVGEDENG